MMRLYFPVVTMSGRVIKDATDTTLFVRDIERLMLREWNRQKASFDALMLETYVDARSLHGLSSVEVERQIPLWESSNSTHLWQGARECKAHREGWRKPAGCTPSGTPINYIGYLIMHQKKENANIPHWPKEENLTLAGGYQARVCAE